MMQQHPEIDQYIVNSEENIPSYYSMPFESGEIKLGAFNSHHLLATPMSVWEESQRLFSGIIDLKNGFFTPLLEYW